MTRNKVISLFLTAVIILSIVIAPLTLAGASQSGQFTDAVLGGTRSLSRGVGAPALPNVLACDGCSGGGTGPV